MQSPSEKSKAGADWVAAKLRNRIVKGELAPRDRLVERRLSEELSVSRTPVREALKLLEADGLIEISHHRGAIVAEFRPEDAANLFDVIAMLEGLAARRCAERMERGLLQRLEDLHAQMLGHFRAGRHGDYFDVNTEIHDLIVEASGNPVMADAHSRLIARARLGRFLAIMEPERLAQAVAEHEHLMEAFRARDPGAAAAIWETHLRHTGESLVAVLSQQTDPVRP